MLNTEQKLNKTELATALHLSQTTLWRAIKENKKKARKYNLHRCPEHATYSTGRKYFYAREMEIWLDEISNFVPDK
ncbi:hypothetical protein DS834_06680 [Lactobacillus bombicola]|uniref:Helix-turn-helix domain-containing protein n=1 Tax=Lactobacillus bombicola TaxID=1505723 RepID=A0ABX9LTL3_9LACO|nr:hypothetical protein [Lactobacillus bombicola]RHW50329.1 hypothetical protein DS834_06680 [Lactobacillus bombicola]